MGKKRVGLLLRSIGTSETDILLGLCTFARSSPITYCHPNSNSISAYIFLSDSNETKRNGMKD